LPYDNSIPAAISEPAGAHLASAGAAAPSAAAGVHARPAVLGPAADFFFLGPGATVLVSVALLTLRSLGPRAQAVAAALTTALTWMFVGPHYAATYRRAYTSRAIVRAHPWVTLAAPPLLLAGAALAVRDPYGFGLAYFAAYVVTTGYHYSGQTLGLALVYPLRQGAPLDATEKRLLGAPLYLSWILTLLGLFGEAQAGRNAAFAFVRGRYQGAPVPAWVLALGLGALALSFAGVAWVAVRRRRRGVPLPAATYAVLSAQTLWFTFGLFFDPFFIAVLVPVFHGLQYVAFTGWHACRGGTAPLGRRFAGYVVPVALLGLAIFPGSFNFFTKGRPYLDLFFNTAAVATFLNLHHFLLDGRIWRLREPAVAKTMLA
jgi:hypothetical protein